MNEFLLVFYKGNHTKQKLVLPEKYQQHLKYWADWFRGLAASDKLVKPVQHFELKGKTVTNAVINGASAELNHPIIGIITIYAADYDEAVEIAMECPVLELGGIVEIRQII